MQDPARGSRIVPGARTLEGEFERTLATGDNLVLDVRTASGRIDVTAGNTGQVRIRGRIRGYADRWTPDGAATVERRVRGIESAPPVEVAGHNLRVGHLASSRHRQVGISYSVEVPPNTRVRAETGAGMLLVRGVTGAVEARTGSGNTRVSEVAGDVAVEADSGDIELDAVGGDMDLRTGSGSIRIEGVEAGLRARTGSGRVRVEGAPARAWNLRAESGDIRIDLPADAAFDVDAQTAAGGVRTNHPISVRGEARPGRLSGAVRGGGPRVTLYTGAGGITID